MRYAYALLGQDLVNVKGIDPADRSGPFFCLGCGERMIPRLGSRVQWHFAHAAGSHCQSETYLHRLGKRFFHALYSQCLQRGEPFVIGLYQRICSRPFADLPGMQNAACAALQLQRYDLTRYFTAIALEEHSGGFVPDLVLKDSHGEAGLFVEIRVSHACSAAKLTSGQRILEIRLQSEQDLALIGRGLREQRDFELVADQGDQIVYGSDAPVRFYNFARFAHNTGAACDCAGRRVFVFWICKYSGKPFQQVMELSQARDFYLRAHHRLRFFRCSPSQDYPSHSQRARRHFRAMLDLARGKAQELVQL